MRAIDQSAAWKQNAIDIKGKNQQLLTEAQIWPSPQIAVRGD